MSHAIRRTDTYEVREVIGQGGMGVVLKAFDPALHRLVAIKVVAAALAGSAAARRRFTREAQAAAAVCHEHVVTVHGVHEADGLPYLVMQYVAGESLQDRLDRAGPLELEDIVRIGLQTASGLAAAHAQGLIHRDVKPANLLLEDGLAKVKITDFGLARLADDAGLTQYGVVAGTPEYMAPEQARGERVDHRADLFSLGSVLYALCTGRSPFRGSSALAVLRRVSEGEPPPLRALNPEVPAWLEALVARLLAKDPAERFQSAAEVAALLEGYLAHLRQPATLPAPELPSPPAAGGLALPGPGSRAARWFPPPLWLAALVLLAAAGLVGPILAPEAPPAEQPSPTTFYQDFRGGRPALAPMQLFGPNAETMTGPEEGGFRITLPADRMPPRVPVGVVLNADVKGNFEITTGYQVLRAERPQSGYGVGFEVYLMAPTPEQDALVLARLARVEEGQVYMCLRMNTTDGKRHYNHKYIPASDTSGRLRVTRKGAEVTCWAAEGAAGDFRELCRFDFVTADLSMVRLGGYTGFAPHAVDLRILDLKVRSDAPLADQALDAPEPDATAPHAGRRGWLVTAELLGLLILALLGGWLYARQRRRTRETAAPSPLPAGQALPEAAPVAVSFACSTCGKKLKVKAELAGKKVKCPQCGKAALVPGTRADEAGPTPS